MKMTVNPMQGFKNPIAVYDEKSFDYDKKPNSDLAGKKNVVTRLTEKEIAKTIEATPHGVEIHLRNEHVSLCNPERQA